MAGSITKKVIDASAMTHHHHRAGVEEFDPATGEEFEVAAPGPVTLQVRPFSTLDRLKSARKRGMKTTMNSQRLNCIGCPVGRE